MVGVPSFMCLAFSLFPLCGVGCSLGIECHIPPHTLPLCFDFCFFDALAGISVGHMTLLKKT